MVKVKLDPKFRETDLNDICDWCVVNIGPGSYRSIPNTWLGTDDWYCYDESSSMDAEDDDDADMYEDDTMFVFRRDSDATLFSLKWS
jgi:hypothetical protein